MLQHLGVRLIFTAWSANFGAHMCVGTTVTGTAYTDFGDSGWCFGANDYYAGTASTAEVWSKAIRGIH